MKKTGNANGEGMEGLSQCWAVRGVCVFYCMCVVSIHFCDSISRGCDNKKDSKTQRGRGRGEKVEWHRETMKETEWERNLCMELRNNLSKKGCVSLSRGPTLFLLAKHQWHSLSGHGEGSRHVSISKQLYRHLWPSASGLNVQTNPSKQDVDMHTLTVDALAYQIWNRETASVTTVNSQRFTSKAEMNRVIFVTWPCVLTHPHTSTSDYVDYQWLPKQQDHCSVPATAKPDLRCTVATGREQPGWTSCACWSRPPIPGLHHKRTLYLFIFFHLTSSFCCHDNDFSYWRSPPNKKRKCGFNKLLSQSTTFSFCPRFVTKGGGNASLCWGEKQEEEMQ